MTHVAGLEIFSLLFWKVCFSASIFQNTFFLNPGNSEIREMRNSGNSGNSQTREIREIREIRDVREIREIWKFSKCVYCSAQAITFYVLRHYDNCAVALFFELFARYWQSIWIPAHPLTHFFPNSESRVDFWISRISEFPEFPKFREFPEFPEFLISRISEFPGFKKTAIWPANFWKSEARTDEHYRACKPILVSRQQYLAQSHDPSRGRFERSNNLRNDIICGLKCWVCKFCNPSEA